MSYQNQHSFRNVLYNETCWLSLWFFTHTKVVHEGHLFVSFDREAEIERFDGYSLQRDRVWWYRGSTERAQYFGANGPKASVENLQAGLVFLPNKSKCNFHNYFWNTVVQFELQLLLCYVGAINNLDQFEQVFEASEKIFTDDISMVHPQKMYIFGVLKPFISNFTYYNLY